MILISIVITIFMITTIELLNINVLFAKVLFFLLRAVPGNILLYTRWFSFSGNFTLKIKQIITVIRITVILLEPTKACILGYNVL